jgi:hypothetical protein
MDIALVTAASLLVLIAVAHSYLGEKYVLIRLFRREDLPRVMGSEQFTKRVLRFAWHVTSIAWVGFAGVLLVFAGDASDARSSVLRVISGTFAASALLTGTASRGRHLSWAVFTAIAVLTWMESV